MPCEVLDNTLYHNSTPMRSENGGPEAADCTESCPGVHHTDNPADGQVVISLLNTETGETTDISTSPSDRSIHRCKQVLTGVRRVYEEAGGFAYLITLTLDDQHSQIGDSKPLDGFFEALRRRSGNLAYAWVAGIQEERLKVSGRAVLHWHLLLISSVPIGSSLIHDLWGLGYTKVKRVRTRFAPVERYLYSHLQGESDVRTRFHRARRYGSSRLGVYRLPRWGYDWVKTKLREAPNLARCTVRKVGSVVGFFERQPGGLVEVVSKKSPWKLVVVRRK